MTKKRKRLLIQVGIITVVFFIILIIVLGTMIYVGSTSMFLSAKNEMIDRDLLRNKEDVQSFLHLSEYLDYWREHIPDITRDLSEEEREAASGVYQREYDPDCLSLKGMDDAEKLVIAHDIYEYTASSFNSEQYMFNYDGIYLIDISEENSGFIYCHGDSHFDFTKLSLGEHLEFDINDQVAVQRMRRGDFYETEYEIVYFDDGRSYYIGYAPITENGKVICAICITYDWSTVRKGLAENLTVMAALGILVMLAAGGLLLHFLYITAVRPLTTIQRSVRGYIVDKDSAKVTENMNEVTSRNEFGVLADDISQLAQEIDRYTDENIKLAADKERVAAELGLATRIQKGTLPDIEKVVKERGEFEISASMTPAKEIGGDFYDCFFIDDDHLALVIADVSGKGIPASLFMMSSMILINDRAVMGGTPSEILEFVNRRICERNTLEMFVTVWLGILEVSTGRLSCANAGHEFPIINTGSGFELFRDKHGFVLGGMDGMKYKTYELRLKKGDCLFVYTDGITEATDPVNELFGTQRTVDALNIAPDASPEELIKNVSRVIGDFAQGSPQADDMTMVCLKYNGTEEP
ncbi:MAG: serine/threonine-protein phosphatase [Ruminiclostridium sp.]|nr:serine/threonine-protein phosphatase [Ruminiclostridium sp.]